MAKKLNEKQMRIEALKMVDAVEKISNNTIDGTFILILAAAACGYVSSLTKEEFLFGAECAWNDMSALDGDEET